MKKTKKISVLFLCAVIFFSVVSCSQPEDDEYANMSIITNDNVDYYVYYPNFWNIDSNGDIIRVRVSDSELSNVTLTCFDAPEGITDIGSYMEKHYKVMFTLDAGDEPIEYNLTEKTGEGECFPQMNSTFTVGDTYKYFQSLFYRNGKIYIFTYTSDIQSYDQHLEYVEKMIKSFTFKKDGEKLELDLPTYDNNAVVNEYLDSYFMATNDAVDYNFIFPKDWELLRNDGMLAARVGNGLANVSVVTFSVPSKVSYLEDYFKNVYIAEFESSVGKLTKVDGEKYETTTVRNHSAITAIFTAIVSGEEYKFYHCLWSRGQYLYSFVYTAKAIEYDTHIDEAKEILSLIEFK